MNAAPVNLANISAVDWSMMLGTGAAASPNPASNNLGQIVQNIFDIDQCIAIILTTPFGSDVLRPTFGSDLWGYVDKPINRVTAAIVASVFAALTKWEPRIKVLGVSAVADTTTGAKLTVTVQWMLALSAPAPTQTTVVAIGGTP